MFCGIQLLVYLVVRLVFLFQVFLFFCICSSCFLRCLVFHRWFLQGILFL